MLKPTTKKNKDWAGLLAQKLAEVRLSEIGFRFVPGIYPVFKRIKQFIEVKARIVKP
jgi:hypothetical protein